MMLKTTHDKIIVLPDKPVENMGLIYIPEQYRSTLWSGVVIAVGPGSIDEKGRFRPTETEVGSRVVIDTAQAVQLDYDGVEYMVTRESELLGVIDGDGEVITWKNEGRLTRREWEATMKEQAASGGVVRKKL
jgi:chaperonin GroES